VRRQSKPTEEGKVASYSKPASLGRIYAVSSLEFNLAKAAMILISGYGEKP